MGKRGVPRERPIRRQKTGEELEEGREHSEPVMGKGGSEGKFGRHKRELLCKPSHVINFHNNSTPSPPTFQND